MVWDKRTKFESVPLSNPNWCRELHQFEPLVTRFARDMRLKMDFRKATLEDIDMLVTTRIEVLRAANELGAEPGYLNDLNY